MSIESDPLDEVSEALGLTTEVLEDLIGDLKASTQVALADEDFDGVAAATDRLRDLRTFATDVDGLVTRWRQLTGTDVRHDPTNSADTEADDEPASKKFYGRVKRGLRTPEPEFRIPILQALVDAGGSLPAADALDSVGKRMDAQLNDTDRQVLPSDMRTLRWRNTAQWARNVLADQGHIDRSVRGTWTITPAGRVWLEGRS